jgi:hypothetical protein
MRLVIAKTKNEAIHRIIKNFNSVYTPKCMNTFINQKFSHMYCAICTVRYVLCCVGNFVL